jgi:hypothetical protein
MKFAILSIPHTGTHFVSDLLGGPNDLPPEKMHTELNCGENQFYISHIYLLPEFERAEDQGYTIVCPLRHPIKTIESWCNWAEITGEYKKDHMQPEYVLKMYKSLIWASELYDLNILPIDSPKREHWLDVFNKKYGLNLATRWRPLNSIGEYVTSTPEELRKKTDHLLTDNSEFFGRYY